MPDDQVARPSGTGIAVVLRIEDDVLRDRLRAALRKPRPTDPSSFSPIAAVRRRRCAPAQPACCRAPPGPPSYAWPSTPCCTVLRLLRPAACGVSMKTMTAD